VLRMITGKSYLDEDLLPNDPPSLERVDFPDQPIKRMFIRADGDEDHSSCPISLPLG